jgi:hypothetical protein
MLRSVVFGGARAAVGLRVPENGHPRSPRLCREWLNQDPYTDLSFRLVPSEDPFYYALLDDTIVHKTGRRATVAARDAMEVLVETISWGYPPSIFRDFTTFVIKVDPTVRWTNIGTS